MAKKVTRSSKGPATAVPFADVAPTPDIDSAAAPFIPDAPIVTGDSLATVIATATDAAPRTTGAGTEATDAVVDATALVTETTANTVEQVTDAVVDAIPEPAAVAAPIEAAETAVTHAADMAADTVQEDTQIMATTFENTTATAANEAPKMFADMNERAKAAMEKSGQVVAEMNEFGKGNVEAMVESSRIAMRGLEALGQDAAEYSRKSFEGLTATLKNLASVKSPTEFFKLQSDWMRTSFDQAVAQTSKSTEAMIKLAGDAAQPLSNRVAVAADKAKTVA
ncbi:phasin family protein [Sphingomonas guangdongensis]|uniref:Phasin family protein n=1 Tax=Sphingomonas guangdongensis TaxID=1141890 RepID=A0A285QBE3_9SPHN|nr:phasin family protein [Sphingomonas guangdongensis]SOB78794.1 phasin family protein [Sphingomonas guangdongensis]